MSIKRYQNELIVLLSLLLLLAAFVYKSSKVSSSVNERENVKNSISEIKKGVGLKRLWGDKSISTKVDKLKNVVPEEKVEWSKKGKKLTAKYKALSSSELNRLISKILNASAQIELLDIKKSGTSYQVEYKCKW